MHCDIICIRDIGVCASASVLKIGHKGMYIIINLNLKACEGVGEL